MKIISLNEENILEEELSKIDLSEILDLVTQGNYKKAAEISSDKLEQGYFDVRLVCYYLFGLCSQDFSKHADYVFNFLSSVLTEQYELLKPLKYKEKQCQNAFNWFMTSLFDFFNYQENKSSRLIFATDIIESYINFQKKIESSSIAIDKTTVGKIRNFIADRVKAKEVKEQNSSDREIIVDAQEALDSQIIQPQKTTQLNGSLKWNILLDKLQLLDELQKKNADTEAAVLFKNIYQSLIHFKPLEYFPDIFSGFYQKVLDNKFQKIINKTELNLTSAQWHALEEIVASDHRLLLEKNMSLPDNFTQISQDKFKQLFEDGSSSSDGSQMHQANHMMSNDSPFGP